MISWLEKHHKTSWIITLSIALLIFYMSSIPSESIPSLSNSIPYKAIIYHILIFFSLTFFLAISLTKGKNLNLIFIVILISLIYGITDELHQTFTPGRTPSISDLMLNSLGIISSSTLYIFFKKKSLKRNHK